MKEIKLIPMIEASDMPGEVCDEFEVGTHYQGDVVYIDWNDKPDKDGWESSGKFKKWLVETYGETIKQYEYFGINPT